MRSLPSKDDTSYTVATHSLSLKDEDRMCTAVADVCGEAIELLLVADGHGGPEVTQHGQAPTLAVLRLGLGPRLKVPLASLGGSALYSRW